MAKKKKKKGFLSEIKQLNPSPLSSPFTKKNRQHYLVLKELLSQFRDGEDDLSLALHQFLELYESNLASHKDWFISMYKQPQDQPLDYETILTHSQATFEAFFANYSPQEQKTLASIFIFSQSTQFAHLDRDSSFFQPPLKLTPSQREDYRFYWIHHQIFSEYLIFPPEITENILKNIETTLFGQPLVKLDK